MKTFDEERLETVRQCVMEFCRIYNRQPTTNEIAEETGISRAGVYRNLKELDRRQAFRYREGELSSYSIDTATKPMVAIPILGSVACGLPEEEEENCEDYIRLPLSLLGRNGKFYGLKAKGESMQGAEIHDGDIVICEHVQDPGQCRDGDIVAALTNGTDNNLKRMYRVEGGIELRPENPDFETVVYEDIAIQGRAVMVIKRL